MKKIFIIFSIFVWVILLNSCWISEDIAWTNFWGTWAINTWATIIASDSMESASWSIKKRRNIPKPKKIQIVLKDSDLDYNIKCQLSNYDRFISPALGKDHFAIIGLKDNKRILLKDWKEILPWSEELGTFALSKDWSKFFYTTTKNKVKWYENNVLKYENFLDIKWAEYSIYNDLFFIGKKDDNKEYLVKNWEIISNGYVNIWMIELAKDSNNYAFEATKNWKIILNKDWNEMMGTEWNLSPFIMSVLSDNGKYIAYRSAENSLDEHDIALYKNGGKVDSWDIVNYTLSPDGEKLVYIKLNNDKINWPSSKAFIDWKILDGQEDKESSVGFIDPIFSPDGKDLIFLKKARWTWIVKNWIESTENSGLVNNLTFFPDSKNYLFISENEDWFQYVIKYNKRVSENYRSIDNLNISPDWNSFVFTTIINGKNTLIINEQEKKYCSFLSE